MHVLLIWRRVIYPQLQIYRTDPLSKDICQECKSIVENYWNFQQNVIDINNSHLEYLRTQIHDKNVQLYLNAAENNKVHVHFNFIVTNMQT